MVAEEVLLPEVVGPEVEVEGKLLLNMLVLVAVVDEVVGGVYRMKYTGLAHAPGVTYAVIRLGEYRQKPAVPSNCASLPTKNQLEKPVGKLIVR